MKVRHFRTLASIMFPLMWALFIPEARASLEPGTGSVIIQALLAAGILVLVFGTGIRSRLAGRSGRQEQGPEPAPPGEGDSGDPQDPRG